MQKGSPKGGKPQLRDLALGTPFSSKISKKGIQNRIKKHVGNNCKIMPKRVPKWSQNPGQNPLKTVPKIISKKDRKIIKNHVFLKCKNMQIYRKGHQK